MAINPDGHAHLNERRFPARKTRHGHWSVGFPTTQPHLEAMWTCHLVQPIHPFNLRWPFIVILACCEESLESATVENHTRDGYRLAWSALADRHSFLFFNTQFLCSSFYFIFYFLPPSTFKSYINIIPLGSLLDGIITSCPAPHHGKFNYQSILEYERNCHGHFKIGRIQIGRFLIVSWSVRFSTALGFRHLSCLIASVFLNFSSHVSFNSAMSFSEACSSKAWNSARPANACCYSTARKWNTGHPIHINRDLHRSCLAPYHRNIPYCRCSVLASGQVERKGGFQAPSLAISSALPTAHERQSGIYLEPVQCAVLFCSQGWLRIRPRAAHVCQWNKTLNKCSRLWTTYLKTVFQFERTNDGNGMALWPQFQVWCGQEERGYTMTNADQRKWHRLVFLRCELKLEWVRLLHLRGMHTWRPSRRPGWILPSGAALSAWPLPLEARGSSFMGGRMGKRKQWGCERSEHDFASRWN